MYKNMQIGIEGEDNRKCRNEDISLIEFYNKNFLFFTKILQNFSDLWIVDQISQKNKFRLIPLNLEVIS